MNESCTQIEAYSVRTDLQAMTERYASRGLVKSVLNEAGEQIRREEQTRESAPEAYRLSLMNDELIDSRYRRGKSAMSAVDLLRYFEETHDSRVAGSDFSEDGGMDLCPVQSGESSAVAVVEKQRVSERIGQALCSSCRTLNERMPSWFDFTQPDTSKNRRSFPLSAFAALLAIAVSLMLIVASSVMLMRAENNVNSLKIQLNETSAELNKLRSDLDVKNDLLEIRRIAVEEYGMVEEEYLKTHYLSSTVEDSVEVFEEEQEESVGLAAILSAIGITK